MPIDFTPLDPRSDPEAWERMVARVLRDASDEDAPESGPGDDPPPSSA